MTLRETIAVYKTRAKLLRFPCGVEGCTCQDYISRPSKKMDEPCREPWPKCQCGHTADKHNP